jgi:hypothetical protein
VFGNITSGLVVIMKIETTPTGAGDRPTTPVKMVMVTINESRGAPPAPPPDKTCKSWPEQTTIGNRDHHPTREPARPARAAASKTQDAMRQQIASSSNLPVQLDSSVRILLPQGH